MRTTRRSFPPEEKVRILRRHFLMEPEGFPKVPVSELCEKHQLSPNVFYRWQKEFSNSASLPTGASSRGLSSRDLELAEFAMMLDQDVVAASPSTVYRVLRDAGLLQRWNGKPSKKGGRTALVRRGFVQPLAPHEHWHVDIAYLNVCSNSASLRTFYYLCSVLDGYSRYVVHWEIRESMTERDVELTLQRARERFPEAHPRIIS